MKWLSGEAQGYTDEFPIEGFAREVAKAERVHLVRGPRGGKHHARCRVKIRGRSAVLDYRAFRAYNDRHSMLAGVMEFEFIDTTRTRVASLRWDGDLVGQNEASVVTEACDGGSEATGLFADRGYGIATRLLRPEQAALYDELERTYGGRCAITGCPVPFALEAAHLLGVADKGADTPSNALLVRADLHALIDANQMAIEPRTRRVYISREAQAWPEYRRLHARCLVAKPQPGFEANAPSSEALEPRWRLFIKEHGKPSPGAA